MSLNKFVRYKSYESIIIKSNIINAKLIELVIFCQNIIKKIQKYGYFLIKKHQNLILLIIITKLIIETINKYPIFTPFNSYLSITYFIITIFIQEHYLTLTRLQKSLYNKY